MSNEPSQEIQEIESPPEMQEPQFAPIMEVVTSPLVETPVEQEPRPAVRKETVDGVERSFAKAGMPKPPARKCRPLKKLGKLADEEGHRHIGRGMGLLNYEELMIFNAKCNEILNNTTDPKLQLQMMKVIENNHHQIGVHAMILIKSEERGSSDALNNGTQAQSFPANQPFAVIQSGPNTQILVGDTQKR